MSELMLEKPDIEKLQKWIALARRTIWDSCDCFYFGQQSERLCDSCAAMKELDRIANE